MGAHFPAVELDNMIWFSTLSRMSWFLWHSSKWACRFGRFLQYTPGLEVLACSLGTDLICNYAPPTAPFHEPLSKVSSRPEYFSTKGIFRYSNLLFSPKISY